MFFFSLSRIHWNPTFFWIIRSCAGTALLTWLLGVRQCFYHRWKGLINLHEKSWSRISFLNSLLLSAGCNRRYFMIERYARGSISRASYVELDKVFTTVGKVWSISMRKVDQESPFSTLSSCQRDAIGDILWLNGMRGDRSPGQATWS